MATSSFNSKFVISDKKALKNLEKALRAKDKQTKHIDINKIFKENEKSLKQSFTHSK